MANDGATPARESLTDMLTATKQGVADLNGRFEELADTGEVLKQLAAIAAQNEAIARQNSDIAGQLARIRAQIGGIDVPQS